MNWLPCLCPCSVTINKANKQFSYTKLKVLTDPLDLTCLSLVLDGGWLLYMVKWEQGMRLLSLCTNHLLFSPTSKGSYAVRRIQEAMSEKQRCYLLFFHAFTGYDTVSAIAGHGKITLFDGLCAGDVDERMDKQIFLDVQASRDVVIFQYIYVPCTRYCLSCSLMQHVLTKCSSWASGSSTFNRRCSCTAFSRCLSTSTELHGCCCRACLYGPMWLWMDIRG